jgi:hypothetical protein
VLRLQSCEYDNSAQAVDDWRLLLSPLYQQQVVTVTLKMFMDGALLMVLVTIMSSRRVLYGTHGCISSAAACAAAQICYGCGVFAWTCIIAVA